MMVIAVMAYSAVCTQYTHMDYLMPSFYEVNRVKVGERLIASYERSSLLSCVCMIKC